MKYRIKALFEARPVNADNLAELAQWCGGKVNGDKKPYVTLAPFTIGDFNEEAYPGDWIILEPDGDFCVYTHANFRAMFEEVEGT